MGRWREWGRAGLGFKNEARSPRCDLAVFQVEGTKLQKDLKAYLTAVKSKSLDAKLTLTVKTSPAETNSLCLCFSDARCVAAAAGLSG